MASRSILILAFVLVICGSYFTTLSAAQYAQPARYQWVNSAPAVWRARPMVARPVAMVQPARPMPAYNMARPVYAAQRLPMRVPNRTYAVRPMRRPLPVARNNTTTVVRPVPVHTPPKVQQTMNSTLPIDHQTTVVEPVAISSTMVPTTVLESE